MKENEIKNTAEKGNKEAEINYKKKKVTIMGLSVWRIMAYFIIYSVVGYIIETIFGIITKGVWESRQSFLYGPFCAIYGLGATIMIIFLHKYSKNYTRLFIGGFIVGSIVEYLVSWIGEILLGVKWWDYSGKILNVNGRVCLLYSIFWGFLTVLLVNVVNPRIDKMCNKLQEKFARKKLKILVGIVIIFLALDCAATVVAQEQFITRTVIEKNIDVSAKDYSKMKRQYDFVKQHHTISNFIDTFWNDKKMILTFPNIKIENQNQDTIHLKDLFPKIKPYYWKFEK